MSHDQRTAHLAALLTAVMVLAAACGPPPPLGAVFIEVGPPPPRVEVIEVRREPGYVLIPGYWAWERGTYVWISPRWAQPPQPHAKWVRPRWHRDRRGWYWVPGRWR